MYIDVTLNGSASVDIGNDEMKVELSGQSSYFKPALDFHGTVCL